MSDNGEIHRALRDAFAAAADPKRAEGQQKYMKSAMPYFGLTAPISRKLSKSIFRALRLHDPDQWQANILHIWRHAEHREERYAAIELLLYRPYRSWITLDRVSMLRELIISGAWWDYVDGLAANAIGHLLAHQPEPTAAMLRDWAREPDIWIRRSAIIAQLKLKANTDFELLVDCIEPSIDEREFFLRKAIGWALREYSKTDPTAVSAFVDARADRLSGLSKREALRVIKKR